MMNFQPPFGTHHQQIHDPYAAMVPPAPPLPVPPTEFTYGGAPPTYQASAMPYDYGGGQKLTAPPLIPPSQTPYHTATSGSAGMGGASSGIGGIGSSAGMVGVGGGATARVSATNTNSKDPKAIKARVFVGNLNTNLVTREQIHQIYAPFGEILAISMHKGYAFVQYAFENEARNAVTFTDGTLLGGKRIDVTISSEPKPSSDDSSGIKRSANVTITLGSADAKKPKLAPSAFAKKVSSYSSSSVDKSSSSTKTTLTSSATTTSSGIGSALKKETLSKGDDIMICGQCRQLFTSVSAFTAHKPKCTAPPVMVQTVAAGSTTSADSNAKNGVATPLTDAKKPDGEPDRLQCFICHTSFEHSWFLLEHMSQKHNMTVYELPPVTVVVDSAPASTDKTKKETSTTKKEKD